jgi:uncharacterized protein (TIGR00297 family)
VSLLTSLLIGLVASSLVSAIALRTRSLSADGALAAIVVGTCIFGCGGWAWGVVLLVFFVPSSLLSRYRRSDKQHLAEKFAKGARRDLGQVLANGGAAATLAVVHAWHPEPVLAAAFAGTMATVTADTWATEIGVLSRRPPRLLTTGRTVAPGTSGGITVLGSSAAAAGAVTIAVVFQLLIWADGLLGVRGPAPSPAFALAAVAGGLAGCFSDSLLGATVQAIYCSPSGERETERPCQADGTRNRLLRGWRWLGNDGVNFVSSLAGGAVAAGLWQLVR